MNHKKIVVEKYNPNWPQIFTVEEQILKEALGESCIAVHHVGSTSVPGLCAKPKIDIIAVVKDPLSSINILENIGYEYRGEWNIPLHYGFRKRNESDVNLHIFEEGNGEIDLNLLFRDYLRNNTELRDEYANLKLNLVVEESSHKKGYVFSGYNHGKNKFIKDLLSKAGLNNVRVNYCVHPEEWDEYHRIKQEQLFIPQNLPYNKNHSSLTEPGNYHFVMYKGIKIVAIAHVVDLNIKEVLLKTMLVDKDYNSIDYKNKFLEFLAKWTKSKDKIFIK